jgi:hypothetical protein
MKLCKEKNELPETENAANHAVVTRKHTNFATRKKEPSA